MSMIIAMFQNCCFWAWDELIKFWLSAFPLAFPLICLTLLKLPSPYPQSCKCHFVRFPPGFLHHFRFCFFFRSLPPPTSYFPPFSFLKDSTRMHLNCTSLEQKNTRRLCLGSYVTCITTDYNYKDTSVKEILCDTEFRFRFFANVVHNVLRCWERLLSVTI